jgi:hypothetical protein
MARAAWAENASVRRIRFAALTSSRLATRWVVPLSGVRTRASGRFR